MAFVTEKEISSRWQIIFKEAKTKPLLNLECKEAFFPQFPINFRDIYFENCPDKMKAIVLQTWSPISDSRRYPMVQGQAPL